MIKPLNKTIIGITFAIASVFATSQPAYAQQEKGDKEVTFFTGGFAIGVGDSSGFSGFSVGGKGGYFLTRKNEVGAATFINYSRSRICFPIVDDNGNPAEECDSRNFFGMSLGGFYRYNFAKKDAKGFPFVVGEINVSDVTRNFTGNISARPSVGYKYFLKRNVAIEGDIGYSLELNKADDGIFNRGREGIINGQFGLSFIF